MSSTEQQVRAERERREKEREQRDALAVDQSKGDRRDQDGLDQRRVQKLEAALASGDPRELRRAGGTGSLEYAEASKRVASRAQAAARGREVAQEMANGEQTGQRPGQQQSQPARPAQQRESLREQTVRRQQELAAQRARDRDRGLGR